MYRLLIVLATIIWGSSFVVVKDVTSMLPPAWILAVRFTGAALIMAVALVRHRDKYFERSHVGYGLLFGLAMFLAYYLQTVGITDTTPGKNAFLTGTYCVIVPFLAWGITKRRPNRFNIVAALLCIVGIGFISLDGSLSIRFGDAMTLACAVFYALHIVLVSMFAEGRDIFVLTMWQFAGVALCSIAVGLIVDPLLVQAGVFSGAYADVFTGMVAGTTPTASAVGTAAPPLAVFEAVLAGVPPEGWASLAYLTAACTTLALLFQNIGQAHIPPASASLLLSLEAVFGVAFSVALGAETLTTRIVFGFALVFAAILVSEVLPQKAANAK